MTARRSSNASFSFSIPGDDSIESVTSRRTLLERIEPNEFVRVHGDRFLRGNRRIRFWGFNLCFGANFPTYEEADFLAPHLAKLGANAIRFHHMDNRAAPNGIWSPDLVDGQRVFDREMVDRLDYFLARLHAVGIYANLNLHVSRTLTPGEGFPMASDLPWWAAFNRWVTYIDAGVQDEILRYSRDLLLHRNPYRDNLRRVEDPGIALIEMMNESSFSIRGTRILSRLPRRFQQSFLRRWNQWLTNTYGSHASMEKAWAKETTPAGPNLFPVAQWSTDIGSWTAQGTELGLSLFYGRSGPKESPNHKAIRCEPSQTTKFDHFQRLAHPGISTRTGSPLTVSYWVRSDQPREHRVEISTAFGGQWRDLGLFESVSSDCKWRKVEFVVVPEEDLDRKAGINLVVGNSAVPIEFADVRVFPGILDSRIPAGQNLDDQSMDHPAAGWPTASHRDMNAFLISAEREWIRKFRAHLTDSLHVQVPILASQSNYLDFNVNEELSDYCDVHTYWNHPLFPSGRDWDPANWTVGNEPMECDPAQLQWPRKSLLRRCTSRIADKPITVTEWNCPEPSYASAGCVPMAAMLGCLQDWDGVFFFDYDSFFRQAETQVSPFLRDYVNDFFSFCGQPIKLAAFSIFSNLFLRGDLTELPEAIWGPPHSPPRCSLAFQARIGVSPNSTDWKSAKPQPASNPLRTPDGSVVWAFDPPHVGVLRLSTPRTCGVWGTIAESSHDLGNVRVTIGGIRPNYGLVILSSMDGEPLENSGSILVLVASHSENVNMKWNETNDSVGQGWGTGPTHVVEFDAQIELNFPSKLRCYALDSRGDRSVEVPIKRKSDRDLIELGGQYQTIWFELTNEHGNSHRA